jgi:hypothetical protein
MKTLVLHKPELGQTDLFGRTVEALMVETSSLAEASYYWSEGPESLIPHFSVKEGLFYISLTDVSCRFLDQAYERFNSTHAAGEKALLNRTFAQSCHFFETMRESYRKQGGMS